MNFRQQLVAMAGLEDKIQPAMDIAMIADGFIDNPRAVTGAVDCFGGQIHFPNGAVGALDGQLKLLVQFADFAVMLFHHFILPAQRPFHRFQLIVGYFKLGITELQRLLHAPAAQIIIDQQQRHQ